MNAVVTITPSEYKGWTLRYAESHDLKSDWRATKGAQSVSASKPDALLWAIDEREKVTVRFATAVPAYSRDYHDNLQPATIHTLADGRVYYRDKDGEHVLAMHDLRPDGDKKRALVHADAHNKKLLAKRSRLEQRVEELKRQVSDLNKSLHYVSDADLLVEAGRINPS